MFEVKWMVYIILFLASIPFVSLLCILSENLRKIFFFLAVLFIPLTKFSFFGSEVFVLGWYRGIARGLELNFVDIILISLFISILFRPLNHMFKAHKTWFFGISLLIVVNSIILIYFRPPWLFSAFEIFRRLKSLLAFVVAGHFLVDLKYRKLFVYAFAVNLILCCSYGLIQRYMQGTFRVSSFFWWPTDYAGYASVYGITIISALFIHKKEKMGMLSAVIIFSAFLCAAVGSMLTVGRVAYFNIVLCSLVTFFSIGKKLLSFKGASVLTVGFLALAVLMGVSAGRLKERLQSDGEMSKEFLKLERGKANGRKYYYMVAKEMIKEFPMGVGLNNWSWYNANYFAWVNEVNYFPYLNQFRLPVQREELSREELGDFSEIKLQPAFAHSTYLLFLGELGYVGLFLYIITILINSFYWFYVNFMSRRRFLYCSGMLSFIFPFIFINFFEPVTISSQNLYIYYFFSALGAVLYYEIRQKKVIN